MKDIDLLPLPALDLIGEPAPPADDPDDDQHADVATAKKRGGKRHCTEQINSRCIKRIERTEMRRAWSESKLLDILDHEFEEGCAYHCISGGDIDSLSYLKAILRRQNLDYVLFSTWCLADDDILQIREWFEQQRIGRIDCYVGEIFPGSYRHEYAYLKEMLAHYNPQSRVCVFKNHSKIYAGTGKKFDFAIESSANINTNPRTEQTTITIGTDIYQFYKDFFDGIKSFTKDYPDWQPWQKK